MLDKKAQIIFSNKKKISRNEIITNLVWTLLSLILTYFIISLFKWDLYSFRSFSPYFFTFLIVQNLVYLTRKHTLKVYFHESNKEFVVIQKNLWGKEFVYKLDSTQESLLSPISDSYGRVNFDIKLGRRSVYLSSHQIGLSKKKVKKIYRAIEKYSTQYKWNTTI